MLSKLRLGNLECRDFPKTLSDCNGLPQCQADISDLSVDTTRSVGAISSRLVCPFELIRSTSLICSANLIGEF